MRVIDLAKMSGVAFALVVLLMPSISVGQHIYTPNHPDVKLMAESAAQYLTDVSPGGRAELVLAALSVIECTKRYENMVPTEHPLVVRAVDTILNSMNGGKANPTGMLAENGVYVPALALIVLCEVGDEKYKDQILILLEELQNRQHGDGGFSYRNQGGVGDTSQIQYTNLALYVAHHHGFDVNLDVAKKSIEWLSNNIRPEGSWWYQYVGNRPNEHDKLTLAIHAAGAGTLYLLADFLQLTPKGRRGGFGNTGLPPSVSIYVKPKKPGEEVNAKKKGPLVNADMGRINGTKRGANQYFAQNYQTSIRLWNYYYLYALERYAYFREKAEGSFREHPSWYDQGVEHLKSRFQANGSFLRGITSPETETVSSALAILFLVRSSEVLVLPSNSGRMDGGKGFAADTRLKMGSNGRIRALNPVKGIEDVFEILNEEDVDDSQFELMADSIRDAITKFAESADTQSRGVKMAFLQGLVADKNYFKRLFAVQALAAEQKIDNVPALLYALGDPDLGICQKAHDGLRLISRKLETISVPSSPTRPDFDTVKKKWTAWFLKIRPGAQLLD